MDDRKPPMQPTDGKTPGLLYAEAVEQYRAAEDRFMNRHPTTSEDEYHELLTALEEARARRDEAGRAFNESAKQRSRKRP
jgi:hypothetical protein